MAENWDGIAKTLGYRNEQHMLSEMYLLPPDGQGKSVKDIAKLLGTGTCTIARRLSICAVEKRKRGGANNYATIKMRLHMMDQRIVLNLPNDVIAQLASAHSSTVYKYVRGVKDNGVLHNLPSGGSGALRPPDEPTFGPDSH